MSVFSPQPTAMPTPGNAGIPSTPAVLQGELPEWAHPTPSPSIFSICPQGSTEPNKYSFSGQRTSAEQTPQAPQVPQVDVTLEFLFEVIRPFITQMCQQLQQELQAKVDQALKGEMQQQDGGQQDREGGRGSSSPIPSGVNPFHSLLHTPTLPTRHSSMSAPMRTTAPISEGCTASERGSQSENPSPSASPQFYGKFPSNGGQAKVPQKILSSNTSPIMSDMAPSSGTAANGPLYLSWVEQQAGQPWSDQRRTPTVSPVVPTMEPPGQVFQSLMRSIDENRKPGGSKPGDNDDGDEGGEKSVMVCRHWKSKGFCRLEDKCKFLHLEHKRGSGAPAAKPKKGDKAGGNTDDVPREGTPTNSKTSRSSRRAGRNRRSGGGDDDGDGGPAAPAAPGLVASG